MKTKTKINYSLIIISITTVITLISLLFLPDRLPMHFGVDGSVDRIGYKYEILILPAVLIISFLLTRYKLKAEKANEKPIATSMCICVTLVSIIDYYMLYLAFSNKDVKTAHLSDIFIKVLLILFGVMFIVLGNIMPKVKRNCCFGLRTGWSGSSDLIWQKTQRFGGFTMVIMGILLITVNLIFSKYINIHISVALILLLAAAELIGSYVIYNKNKDKE